jgi:hypothetical protein
MPRRSKGLVGAGAIAMVIALAACGSGQGGTRADAGTTKQTLPKVVTTTTEAAKPFNPNGPIDLSGTPGVTPAELHRSEALLRATIADLKKYRTPEIAEMYGYRTIGDRITGDEHYVNWSYVNDGHILDPERPESLVYEFKPDGTPYIAAAMYMLPLGSRFSDVPDVGGPLTQWHVHNNLCLTNDPNQKMVVGLTTAEGGCPAGTSKAGNTPMLHVWVVPNECGPFAALEGIGAGQVPAGQTRLCDTLHGSATNG